MSSYFNLRDYQTKLANEACEILQRKSIVCLFMQVRTGKSLTALQTCQNFGAKRVLFITKIRAFSSVQFDYDNFGYKFDLTIINRESLHKIITNDFDVVVIDEVHGFASYPKPSKYFKDVKFRFGDLPMILLSGTPTPESYSQFYHIFGLSNHSPFQEFKNFYKWAEKYVDVQMRYLGYAQVKDYSSARKKDFWHLVRYYILTYTQEQAGFTTSVNEMILQCEPNQTTKAIINKLLKDFVAVGKSGKVIMADTGVKLQQKVHQIENGTIIFEDGTSAILDTSKAEFIKEKFEGYKMAIFYYYRKEWELLKQVFGNDLTNDLNEFNETNKHIALQQISGAEGISLAKSDVLVFYNFGFSNTKYTQAKDRLTTMQRKENTVFFVVHKDGINEKIYRTLQGKKDYILSTFKKDFDVRVSNTEKNNQEVRSRRVLRS